MDLAHELIRLVHVSAGFTALVAFWVPVFARKGARLHVLAGRVFKYCAYAVLGAAAVGLVFLFAQLGAQGLGPESTSFSFLIFLSYLTLVTYAALHQGLQVLHAKRDLAQLDTRFNRSLAWLAIAASVVMVAYAIYYAPANRILLFALSPIGISTGLGMRRANRGQRPESKAWFYEHMGAMLGCGIAFHTAFAVFGSQAIFQLSLPGWSQVIPWVLPALIGVPAITIWTRYYQRKFRDLPA